MVVESVGGDEKEEEEGKGKKKAEKEQTAQQVATVPYLLFLAQGGLDSILHLHITQIFVFSMVHLCSQRGDILKSPIYLLEEVI